MNAAPALLELLGASWEFGAPVVAVAWGTGGHAAGFALGDGHLAVAKAEWPGGPRVEPKPGGGLTVLPADAPALRPVRVACHQGGCQCIAADASGGFFTGGDDGRVVQVPRIGDPVVAAEVPGAWINAIATNRHEVHAYASARLLNRSRAARSDAIELPAPATALAFSPDGRCLAAAHGDGVTLWPEAGLPRQLAWRGYHRALAWSPNGDYLVTGMQENALHGWRVADGGDIEMGGYPGQPLSLSFSHDGCYLATSGGTRPVCWGFDPPGAGVQRDAQPVECGIPSKTPVTCVACHPRQSLIATGYFNGAVLLCRPGSEDGLFIKGAGSGAVNALAWSADGSRLAFGTQEGVFGWVGLPDALFAARPPAPPLSKIRERTLHE